MSRETKAFKDSCVEQGQDFQEVFSKLVELSKEDFIRVSLELGFPLSQCMNGWDTIEQLKRENRN